MRSPFCCHCRLRLMRFSRNCRARETCLIREICGSLFRLLGIEVGLGRATGSKVWEYKGPLLHDLRRSGVRNLIRSGVPRRIAIKISGYLTESTFERYNIVDSTDLHEAMAKVEKYFDGNLMAVEENQQHSGQQGLSFQSKPR